MVPPDSDRAPPTPPYSGSRLGSHRLRVRVCHPLRNAFPGGFRCRCFFHIVGPATPRAPRRPRFGLAPFRSPLLGGSLLFSSPPATWMFRFAGFAPAPWRVPCLRTAGFPIRASADLRLLAPPRGISPPAAPFVASGSHGHPPCALARLWPRRLPAPRGRSRCPSRASRHGRAPPHGAPTLGQTPRVAPAALSFYYRFPRILSMNRARAPRPGLRGEWGSRTPGLRLAKPALRPAELIPRTYLGSPGQTRTADPHIISVVL